MKQTIYEEAKERLGLENVTELPDNKELVFSIIEDIEYSRYEPEEIREFFDFVFLSRLIEK